MIIRNFLHWLKLSHSKIRYTVDSEVIYTVKSCQLLIMKTYTFCTAKILCSFICLWDGGLKQSVHKHFWSSTGCQSKIRSSNTRELAACIEFGAAYKVNPQVSLVWPTSGMGWVRDGMIVYISLACEEWSSLRGKLDPCAAVWDSKWVNLLSKPLTNYTTDRCYILPHCWLNDFQRNSTEEFCCQSNSVHFETSFSCNSGRLHKAMQ